MNTEKEKGLSRANENSPMPKPEHDYIIAGKPLDVKGANNPLRMLRTVKMIPARDLVETVQEIFPGYDKMLQSKCENGDKYGIELRRKALDALLAKYSPETLEKVKHQRNGRHKLKSMIMCRLEEKDYNKLHELIRADGFETMQSFLTYTIHNYIINKEKENEYTEHTEKSSSELQAEYCRINQYPLFAPSNGRCSACGENIYGSVQTPTGIHKGYSKEEAATRHITSCPHCHHTFCD